MTGGRLYILQSVQCGKWLDEAYTRRHTPPSWSNRGGAYNPFVDSRQDENSHEVKSSETPRSRVV